MILWSGNKTTVLFICWKLMMPMEQSSHCIYINYINLSTRKIEWKWIYKWLSYTYIGCIILIGGGRSLVVVRVNFRFDKWKRLQNLNAFFFSFHLVWGFNHQLKSVPFFHFNARSNNIDFNLKFDFDKCIIISSTVFFFQ